MPPESDNGRQRCVSKPIYLLNYLCYRYAWDSFSFGMFETLEMIERMGFGTDRQGSWGAMITLNYRVETPESCALFAEYCFGGAGTKGGQSIMKYTSKWRNICLVLGKTRLESSVTGFNPHFIYD